MNKLANGTIGKVFEAVVYAFKSEGKVASFISGFTPESVFTMVDKNNVITNELTLQSTLDLQVEKGMMMKGTVTVFSIIDSTNVESWFIDDLSYNF